MHSDVFFEEILQNSLFSVVTRKTCSYGDAEGYFREDVALPSLTNNAFIANFFFLIKIKKKLNLISLTTFD